MIDDFRQYMDAQRTRVEGRLRAILGRQTASPPALLEAMGYSLFAPGKRLRPLLVLMAAEAADGEDEEALPAACAVEMIHTYSLIHDDLPAMDDDDLRRGQPTCHKQFGEALAILAGDALLTLAFQVLADDYPPATAAACCRALAWGAGAAGMVGGQVLDLAWEPGKLPAAHAPAGKPNVRALESVHAHKTGALFRTCLQLGVLAAQGEAEDGPDPGLLECLDAYGRCLGLLFQITDDLLDVECTAAQTGKGVQKDAARGKLTYPGFLGLEESKRRAEQLCRQAVEHLRPLGESGRCLAELARLIVERNR